MALSATTQFTPAQQLRALEPLECDSLDWQDAVLRDAGLRDAGLRGGEEAWRAATELIHDGHVHVAPGSDLVLRVAHG